jgi:PPOX class probable F420-dependent enzyme
MDLPDDLVALLRRPSPCLVSTTMPSGSPHLTQTWVDTDGEHVVVNTVRGYQKLRNVERDPRVGLAVLDPDDPFSYWSLDGEVVELTEDGGAEHIEALSQKYTGRPYVWHGGRDQVRVVMRIRVTKVRMRPWS